MAIPKVKVRIHGIIRTKDEKKLIRAKFSPVLYGFIRNSLEDGNCKLTAIGGDAEHVHILFESDEHHTLADIFKQLKTASSEGINAAQVSDETFGWEAGYLAFSVSESQSGKMTEYINAQKEFHQKLSFREEYEGYMKLYGFEE